MTRLIWILMLVGIADASAADPRVIVSVVDVDSGEPIACRLYLQSVAGKAFYFSSLSADGSAVKYEKQNWANKQSAEYHTTVSAHPCSATVPPGAYTLTVERGKTYFPQMKQLTVTDRDVEVDLPLQRWIDTASLGWYSGDTHLHRELNDLENVVIAEDLNVAFPLTYWVTLADRPPSTGDKNIGGTVPNELIRVDDEHVIWPRNTEYEIFSVNDKQHTLGALFVLGHSQPLQQTVPPWKPVIDASRAADPRVLFDMDKLAWPFAMVLPTLAPDATYELSNNHLWRTEFGLRDWYTPAPNYIQPPFGGTRCNERQWIDLTLGMYYTLLDCGFRLPPTAGTANGVHPVPAGFGRVYVPLPNGFDYDEWRSELKNGNSFVTTGPMLFAKADDTNAGHTLRFNSDLSDAAPTIPVHVEVISEQPLSFGEIVINGRPEHLLRPQNIKTATGAYRSVIDRDVTVSKSGWLAVRFWEDRPAGRVRFAHTAPWYIEFDGQPTRPRSEERRYLIGRMRDEIQRSRGVVSAEGIREYQQALEFYQALEIIDDEAAVAQSGRKPASASAQDRWLENMVVHHRFSPEEVRQATGLPMQEAEAAVATWQMTADADNAATIIPTVRVLPYPGGRHPRRGFLDGALDPQRETKVSLFAPWENGGYAVVDVPEAIFSNLGLTYLAHDHIPTIWSEKSIELPKLEWKQTADGLEIERTLPNGIAFGSRVVPSSDGAKMEMWLNNGTPETLTGLRSQVCVMLSGLVGFNTQHQLEQVVDPPFVAVRSDDADRWIITAWTPNHRSWTNPPVPCIHSDPIFPDCPPGESVRVSGGLWFYEGNDVKSRIAQLAKTGWSQSQ